MNLSNLYTDENLINFQEDIKFLINSEIRLKILGCLYNSAASIKQIEEKQYEADLCARGIVRENIYKYGFAFRGKEVLIGGR